MYRNTGAGDEAVPPALMCMVTILQGYLVISDAEAVELSIVDARWQMVLGCLGTEEPPFLQRGLQGFRERLIKEPGGLKTRSICSATLPARSSNARPSF